MRGVLTGIGVLIVGIVVLIFDVVVGRTAGIAAGLPLLALVLALLVVFPEWAMRHVRGR